MSFKEWWADDWHLIPRWSRDLKYWLKGARWTRVDYTVMTYDEATGDEHLDTVRIPLMDVPHGGLHVSGRGYREFVDDQDG